MSESETKVQTIKAAAGPLFPRARREGAGKDDQHYTRVGILDGTHEVVVDAGGAISIAKEAPLIDWWIAGDERWYYPSSETTCTQRTLPGSSVVETAIKVPGGQAVQRVYAIQRSSEDGGGEAIVVEVENASVLPFGLAFAVRPYTFDGDATTAHIELRDTTLFVDGEPMLLLAKAPSRAIAQGLRDGDLAGAIADGAATASSFDALQCADDIAQAAVIVPVAHRTTYRAVIALPMPTPDGAATRTVSDVRFPSALPTAHQVADGWNAQLRSLATVSVPDPRIAAFVQSAAVHMMAAPIATLANGAATSRVSGSEPRWDHVAAIVCAASEIGLQERAEALLVQAAAAADVEAPGAPLTASLAWLVIAAGEHLARFPSPALATALVETVAVVVRSVDRPRARWRRRTSSTMSLIPGGNAAVLQAAAVVFEQAGDIRAASDASGAADRLGDVSYDLALLTDDDLVRRALWARHAARTGRGAMAWGALEAMFDAGAATLVWPSSINESGAVDHDSVATIAAMSSLLWSLLSHVDDERVRMLPAVPASWLGQKLEIHGLVTERGTVGFVVRWHGKRPALLWQIDPTASVVAEGVDCAALDPTWHSHALQGDTILAEMADLEIAKPQGVVMSGLQITPKAPRSD